MTRLSRLPTSAVLWEGPSAIDEGPIVAIVTGLVGPSSNSKTGPMATVWYLRRDQSPTTAIESGADSSICGDCAFRGNSRERLCYVAPMAPAAIWESYRAGKYLKAPGALSQAQWPTRLGGYGDPTCVPFGVHERLLHGVRQWTGYTSMWTSCDQRWRDRLMASAKTPAEALSARSWGWRTYRVSLDDEELLPGEIFCPYKRHDPLSPQCVDCGLCNGVDDGDKRASIVNRAHGGAQQARKYAAWRGRLAVVG